MPQLGGINISKECQKRAKPADRPAVSIDLYLLELMAPRLGAG
jgi:hypothetical protein